MRRSLGHRRRRANGLRLRVECRFLLYLSRWRFLMFVYLSDDSSAMVTAFRDAMAKVANNGQNVSELVDCSEVIPKGAAWKTPASLPAGHTVLDVEDSVSKVHDYIATKALIDPLYSARNPLCLCHCDFAMTFCDP